MALAALALAAACGGGGGGGVTGSSPPGTTSSPAPPATTSRPPADPIFDPARLHEVRIEIDPGDWAALRASFWTNQYYAADITIDGERVQQVGIRSRGNATRNETKPGLKVDFNRYAPTQEFHGYKTLVLDNHYTDVTLMREALAFTVFEAMGIPAPGAAHARVTVNGEYWGVYSLVQPVSKPFLKSRLGEESGNLFDYEWVDHWDFSIRGDEAGAYVPLPFDPETNEDKLDPGGLMELVRVVNQTPDASFLAEVGRLLDLNQFLAYVAVENALAEQDGFVGEQGVNNLYLYEYGNKPGFTFIPWDKDSCLHQGQWPAMQRMGDNVLTARLMVHPSMQSAYTSALRRAATFVSPSFLGPHVDRMYALIRTAVQSDTKKPYSNEDFENGVGGLRGVIDTRARDITAQVGSGS